MRDVKPGDWVHARLQVESILPDGMFQPVGSSEWWMLSRIVHVEPGPLKAGDTVQFYGRLKTIIAVHKDLAWIEDIHGGGCTTEKLAHLERADA